MHSAQHSVIQVENPVFMDDDIVLSLSGVCEERRIQPGEIVRQCGEHYDDALLIVDGSLEANVLNSRQSSEQRATGPIGEIGFLWGTPASATVTARRETRVLLVNDNTLDDLKTNQPALASAFVNMLVRFAQQRSPAAFTGDVDKVEIFLCRDQQQLRSAQALRYDVYCRELGRSSPYAVAERGIITDELDASGQTFIAVSGGEAVGTLRANLCSDGLPDWLRKVYGLDKSPAQAAATAICTKFIIRRSARGGPTATRLISALARYLIRRGIKECYIDCIPPLLHYYRAMGFERAGEEFLHPECGPSLPMKLDLERHGRLLSGELGFARMMQIYIKAKSYKLMEKMTRA